MPEHNPYDFLSGDAPDNGVSPELSAPPASAIDEHAPDATIPREESVALLEAREAFENSEQADTSLATVPELAPLAETPVAPGYAPDGVVTPTHAIDPDNERPAAYKDKELDLFEHLRELRVRMLRTIAYVLVASIVTWNYTKPIQDFLLKPARKTFDSFGIKGDFVTNEPMQAFTTYFQLALVSALIASAPFILYELWAFIEPALTNKERRYTGLLLPFSIILFVAGCALGYYTSPLFFNFFLQFQPPGTVAMWTYSSVVVLLGKMLLVFGVCFQVPVVTIFLNKTGIVSRNVLMEHWRHVVVVIFIVVSIITPTWDPFTLMICSFPPCILYVVSVWLVKWL